MVGCEVCGAADRFLYRCEHCGGQHCEEHHPGDAHHCDEAPVDTSVIDWGPPPDDLEEPTFEAEPPRPQEQTPVEPAFEAETPQTQEQTPVDPRVEPEPSQTQERTPVEPTLPRAIDVVRPSSRVLVALILLLLASAAALGAYALADPYLPDAEIPGFGGSGEGEPAGAVEPVNETAVERLVIQEVNRFRSAQNRSMLSVDPELGTIARYHSEDMATGNYTGHVAPDGETVADRFDRFGYPCESPSEFVLFTEYGREIDLGETTTTFETQAELADGIVRLWRRSPPHREALLAASWERVGVGVVVTPSNRVYVTLNGC